MDCPRNGRKIADTEALRELQHDPQGEALLWAVGGTAIGTRRCRDVPATKLSSDGTAGIPQGWFDDLSQ